MREALLISFPLPPVLGRNYQSHMCTQWGLECDRELLIACCKSKRDFGEKDFSLLLNHLFIKVHITLRIWC